MRPYHDPDAVRIFNSGQHLPIGANLMMHHLLPPQPPRFRLRAHAAPPSGLRRIDDFSQCLAALAEAQAGGKVEGENVLDDDEDSLFGQPEEVERFIGVGGSIRGAMAEACPTCAEDD